MTGTLGKIGSSYAAAYNAPAFADRMQVIAEARGWTPNELPDLPTFRRDATARRQAVRAMLSDESVKAGTMQKLFGVSQLDLGTMAADSASTGDRAAAAFVREALTNRLAGGIPKLVENIALHAMIEGHSICEPVWATERIASGRWAGKKYFASVKARPPGSYKLIEDAHSNIAFIRYNGADGKIVDADPGDFIHFTYLRLYSSPTGLSDLEAAYKHYLIKVGVQRLREVVGDRLAGGLLVAKGESTAALKAALAAARGCGYIVLAPGTELAVVNLAGAADDRLRAGIEDCDRATLVALNGGYLHVLDSTHRTAKGSSEGDAACLALLQGHLAAAVSVVLTQQLAPMLVRENFADNVESPTCKLSAIDPERARCDMEIARMLQAAGVPLSAEEVSCRSGWGRPLNRRDAI